MPEKGGVSWKVPFKYGESEPEKEGSIQSRVVLIFIFFIFQIEELD